MNALLVMQLHRLEEGKLKIVIGAAFADIALLLSKPIIHFEKMRIIITIINIVVCEI